MALLALSCSFDRSGLPVDPAPDGAAPDDGPTAFEARVDGEPPADIMADTGPPVWQFRKRVTVDAKMVTGHHQNFPLLVMVQGDTELATGARTDGRDIHFRAIDDSGRYAYEIEHYNSGNLAAWVKLPELSESANAELYLYYGNASATGAPAAGKVWTSDYAGVWHLTGNTVRDSSDAGHTATVAGGVTEVPGIIGGGRQFDTAATTHIALGDPSLQSNAPFTIELWFRPNKTQADWIGLATKGRATDQEWAGLWLKPDKLLTLGWGWNPPGAGNMDSKSTKPAAGAWHHAAAVFDGTLARLYYNGLQDGNSPKGQAYNKLDGPLVLGTDLFGGNPSFDGVIDEVRLSTVARSAAWIATQHANQLAPTTHVKIGQQELAQ